MSRVLEELSAFEISATALAQALEMRAKLCDSFASADTPAQARIKPGSLRVQALLLFGGNLHRAHRVRAHLLITVGHAEGDELAPACQNFVGAPRCLTTRLATRDNFQEAIAFRKRF